jgi:hypothetical protein
MPTYTPLQSIQLASSSSSVIFSNIPQNYEDLVIVMSVRGTSATNDIDVSATFNGDSSSIYSNTRLYGTSSTVGPQRGTGLAYARLGNMTGSGSYSTYSVISLHLLRYSNTSVLKSTIGRSNNPNRIVDLYANLWRSTSAINSISITAGTNFDAGCTFDLYGISPVASNNAQASGGTEIYYDSTYVYHVFKGSGTFTPYKNLTCDYLMIAGGAGGGSSNGGGGGGAGGLLYTSGGSFTASTSYPVVIGAGGPGSTDGTNTTFNSLTALKGGKGGSSGGAGTGGSGTYGSGGGAGRDAGSAAGGAGTSGQGFAGGGPATGSNANGGSGGGGAGGTGYPGKEDNSANNGGLGGIGSSTYSSWGLATGTGENISGTYYYAGGGGGAPVTGNALGGSGGGGRSATFNSSGTKATSGITNTGGGGGGGGTGTWSSLPGSGGSGLVIIRYAR